jgi:putative ABC transport system permease protein
VLLLEAIRQALRTIWSQKLRATLTLFGFVWGTAAVIFLVGWGDGVRTMLEHGFAKAGKNMGLIHAGKLSEDFTPASDRRILWFNDQDLVVARNRARWADQVAGESQEFVIAAHRQTALTVDLRGMEPETMDVRGTPVASGRGITRTDLDHRRRIVVLGHGVRRKLLGVHGGIGSYVRINGIPFEVVGVLERVGLQLNRDGYLIDDQAWIPLSTFQANWPRWWTDEAVVDQIIYRARDRHLYETTRDELRAILADQLGVPRSDPEAIGGWSPMHMLNKIPLDQTRDLMFIIAVTMLVIGGVGILNMMLDSVHERRQEIGIRLAVGARRRDVLLQFFLETFVVSFLGGGLGVALGTFGCLVLGGLDVPDLVPTPELSIRMIVIAVSVMTFIGFASGLLPAWRATRVDPSLTLRME